MGTEEKEGPMTEEEKGKCFDAISVIRSVMGPEAEELILQALSQTKLAE